MDDPKEKTPEEIQEMSAEELEKVEKPDEETPPEETPASDSEDKETPPEGPEGKEPPTEDEMTPKEEKEEEKKPPASLEEATAEITKLKKMVKDNVTAFRKKGEEAAQERQKRLDAEKKLKETEAPKPPEEMSPEDEKDLKENFPDEWWKWKEEQRTYKEYQDKLKTETETEQSALRQDHQAREVVAFGASLLGIDLEKTPSKYEEVFTQIADKDSDLRKKLVKVDDTLNAYFRPNEKGIFTADQMTAAYTLAFKDDILTQERTKAREEVVAAMEKGNGNASPLDMASASDRSGSQTKKLDDYSQADLLSMSEAQLDQVMKANNMAFGS